MNEFTTCTQVKLCKSQHGLCVTRLCIEKGSTWGRSSIARPIAFDNSAGTGGARTIMSGGRTCKNWLNICWLKSAAKDSDMWLLSFADQHQSKYPISTSEAEESRKSSRLYPLAAMKADKKRLGGKSHTCLRYTTNKCAHSEKPTAGCLQYCNAECLCQWAANNSLQWN